MAIAEDADLQGLAHLRDVVAQQPCARVERREGEGHDDHGDKRRGSTGVDDAKTLDELRGAGDEYSHLITESLDRSPVGVLVVPDFRGRQATGTDHTGRRGEHREQAQQGLAQHAAVADEPGIGSLLICLEVVPEDTREWKPLAAAAGDDDERERIKRGAPSGLGRYMGATNSGRHSITPR